MVAIEAEKRLTRIYHENYSRLLAYALAYTSRANAEDIVSESFLIAWRRLDDLPSRELPWLIGVARNLIRERYRADRRLRELCTELAAEHNAVSDVAEQVTARATALRALAELGDADREVLTLLSWHGLTNREAAEVLGCSTATLLVRVHRARRRLRDVMTNPTDAGRIRRPHRLIDMPQETS